MFIFPAPSSTIPSALLTDESALIGNSTDGGGLAAIRDGDTDEAIGACSQTNNLVGTSYNGVDWGASNDKTITRFTYYGSNSHAISYDGSGHAETITLNGSTDNFVGSDVELWSGTTGTGLSEIIDVTSGILTTTAYRYHRIGITGDGANYTVSCAELELYGF